MTRRPRSNVDAREDDGGKVVTLRDARFRFKWIERDVGEIRQGLEDLGELVKGHTVQLEKLNRNVLVMGILIIGLGIGSKVLSEPTIEIIKHILGLI